MLLRLLAVPVPTLATLDRLRWCGLVREYRPPLRVRELRFSGMLTPAVALADVGVLTAVPVGVPMSTDELPGADAVVGVDAPSSGLLCPTPTWSPATALLPPLPPPAPPAPAPASAAAGTDAATTGLTAGSPAPLGAARADSID